METVEGEGWAGTVAKGLYETLQAVPIGTLDADRRVDAEASRPLPGEHVGGGGLVEELMTTEVAEDATLDGALELLPVDGLEVGGLVEPDATV